MGRKADSGRVAFWGGLIEQRRRRGLSVAQVCEQARVSPTSFYQWQRKLRSNGVPVPTAASDRGAASCLVPVHIVADPPAGRGDSTGVLEIEFPGEIRLRIPAGCDRATLQLVLSTLLPDGGREGGSC